MFPVMLKTWLPYILAYLSIAIFVIAVIVRFFMWAKLPIHLRWELYPVAHEGQRARYGGSYLEEGEWWKKPRHSSLWGELKVMVPEILFLAALREHNPRLWWRSFPFHFGLYLVIACTGLMAGAGVLAAFLPEVLAGTSGRLMRYATLGTGVAGLALGILGALGLLQRRLGTRELKEYTSGADIFNLLFFVVAFGVALLTFLLVDRDFGRVAGFVVSLVTFQPVEMPGTGLQQWLPLASVVVLSLLCAYIPLTHMSHFVGKYFAFHAIRWNDTPNLRGGPEEGRIQEMLTLPVSWSAPHIQGGGTKSWAEVATTLPRGESKK